MSAREESCTSRSSSKSRPWLRSADRAQKNYCQTNFKSVKALTTGAGWRKVSAKDRFGFNASIGCNNERALSRCSLLALLQLPFNSGIRNQPEERDKRVQSAGDP